MTSEQMRAKLMKDLYDAYMDTPWRKSGWAPNAGSRDEEFISMYREAEWLQDHGFIQCRLVFSGISDAKITTKGRDAYEAGEFSEKPDPASAFR